MFARNLIPPNYSFFLFGPRGVGKSFWLKRHFEQALWFDLLKNDLYLRLLKNPSIFRNEVEGFFSNNPDSRWVVIDEIQKLPALLDEIHYLISQDKNYNFAITGSSARKLKRGGANLLAGRAVTRAFFPLTLQEIFLTDPQVFKNFYTFSNLLEDLLSTGMLPAIRRDSQSAIDLLGAYISTYLKEEIQQESLTRNIPGFSRFLEIASIMNGQIVNSTRISSDAGVSRQTVNNYFQILEDTLIGFFLPSWQPRLKVRERANPKFYFFDCGVVRALHGRLREKLESSEKGRLFETLIINEVRAYLNLTQCGGTLSYWRTPADVEVDLIWSRGDRHIAIEIKSTTTWKKSYQNALENLLKTNAVEKAYCIYLGENELLEESGVKVLPVSRFVEKLYRGEIIA